MATMNIEVACLSTSKIKKELKRMSRGKSGDANCLSMDLSRMQEIFYKTNSQYLLTNAYKTVLYQVL